MSATSVSPRGLGGAFALCALASLTLLANHPMPRGPTLADFIRAEAHNQLIDAVVHGGFAAVLTALIVCFVLLPGALPARGGRLPGIAVVVALVSFCVGSGALLLSMILDGFVVPALAAQFSAAASDPGKASGIFLLCGVLIRFLMPAGLLFQAVTVLCWSARMVRDGGWSLAVGIFGLAAGAFLAVALLGAPRELTEHLLLGAIVLQSLWYLGLAAVLWRRRATAHGLSRS
ncbi:MAG: hypothetical protein JO184_13750 [Gammaproteobacteria bacterium]|nr:hypothetical protein [Gammaproteobacteria bacterium]